MAVDRPPRAANLSTLARLLELLAGNHVHPGQFLVFFKTGPLAWNGLLVWWLPLFAFLIWFVPNFVCHLRAVAADDGEPTGRNDRLGRGVAELRARMDAGTPTR